MEEEFTPCMLGTEGAATAECVPGGEGGRARHGFEGEARRPREKHRGRHHGRRRWSHARAAQGPPSPGPCLADRMRRGRARRWGQGRGRLRTSAGEWLRAPPGPAPRVLGPEQPRPRSRTHVGADGAWPPRLAPTRAGGASLALDRRAAEATRPCAEAGQTQTAPCRRCPRRPRRQGRRR
jgi:hypothetical protein